MAVTLASCSALSSRKHICPTRHRRSDERMGSTFGWHILDSASSVSEFIKNQTRSSTAVIVFLITAATGTFAQADQIAFATICSGAATLNNGSVVTIGQPFIGTMSASDNSLILRVGFDGLTGTGTQIIGVDDVVARPAAGEFLIPASTLLANDSDIGGHPLTLTSVSPTSVHGASVTLIANVVHYVPPAGFTNSDSFTYTIGDGTGTTASATVTLNVIPPVTRPILKLTGIEDTPGGRTIHFGGLPGVSYTIQVSNDLITWSALGTLTADSTGAYQIIDPDVGVSARFYRAVVP